ncbi:DUF3566 domain-containing protein [Curtobacterium ammoniigenes]|uniref:DUF3566 domain-containing protein n=1 Tax=Curtobacterium ammoniigenes TaxID=395387 RepID=UPI00082C5CF8|nr:DUF3566 domain-containing protein [Curtobacterium ammoniigenes]
MQQSDLADALRRKDGSGGQPTRQVRLRFARVSIGSIAAWAFICSLGFAIVQVIAICILWAFLKSSGVFAAWNSAVGQVTTNSKYSVTTILSFNHTFLFAIVIGIVGIVLTTIGAIIAAALYRLVSRLTGGMLVGFQRAAR